MPYDRDMGLFRKRTTVAGTARIVSCSRHGGEGRWQNCRMHLVVEIEGREPYPAETHQIAPRKKWPQPGLVVPVNVDADDPSKVKVDFDEMPSNDDRARDMAAQQAGAMGGADRSFTSMFHTDAPQVNVIGDIGQLDPDQLARIEQMTGLDLDGDGTVGGPPKTSTGGGGDDRVGQLERLAQLHASGALTDDEFAAEKRRILGT